MNTTMLDELLKRVEIKPGLMGGKPVIRGLRFPVADILEMLASGMTNEAILEQHPMLEAADIKAALLYASHSLSHTRIVYAA